MGEIEHLNGMLRGIRNVNRLITRETDRDRLLQGACENLVQTLGYYNAWIVLLDGVHSPLAFAHAGFDGDFAPMAERLERGHLPSCACAALEHPGVVAFSDPPAKCTDCPLAPNCHGRGAMIARLEHAGKVHGLFTVSVPADFATDAEARDLFAEVADDVALALHKLDLEKRRALADKALRESEERYRDLLAAVTAYRYTVFFEGGVPAATEHGDGCRNVTGFAPADLEANPSLWFEMIYEHDRHSVINAVKKVVSGHETVVVEHRVRRRDGAVRWVRDTMVPHIEGDGALTRYDGLIEDITDRKRAEEAVAEERQRLLSVFEALPEFVCVIAPDYSVQFANRRYRELFGDPDNRPCYEVIEGRKKLRGSCPTLEVFRTGQAHHWEWTSADGRDYVIHDTPFALNWGKPLVLELGLDITNRKRAEQEKARLESQLRQAQKMEAIGTLAAGIAHDFNNLLFSASGFTELALAEVDKPSQAATYLGQVMIAHQRAAELVKQILAFSRQSDQERQPLRLQSVLKEALRLLRASLPSTIGFRQDIDPSTGFVLADPTEIHQVIMNLCANAYQAMREKGGLLAVSLKEVDVGLEQAAADIHLNPGRYACLTVADTGCGMDAKVLGRVFEPYFTTKGPGEGTGMGLSTVHGIVNSHQGAIHAYSEPGQGATFRVYFPLHVHETPTDREATPDAGPVHGTERILFVDDEPQIVMLGKRVLEALGYDVQACTASLDALETFRADPRQFDAVVTDQTMPGLTGMQLAKELLKLRPDLPIILCTGFSEAATKAKVREAGIREYVNKPVLTQDLARAIRRALADGPNQQGITSAAGAHH